MSHRHQRLLISCPPSSPCPAFPPPLRPPPSALDSTAISDKTSRYRSVLRRRQPEGNPWRGLGPGHGTGYVPRPVRPSSHSALLGKPPPTEAPRCTLALPAVRARREEQECTEVLQLVAACSSRSARSTASTCPRIRRTRAKSFSLSLAVCAMQPRSYTITQYSI